MNPPVLLNDTVENYHTLSFTAGQVKNHLCQWETITQDPVILNAIQHYNIEFEETPPLQIVIPKNIIFSASDREIVNNEIAKLLSKGVIEAARITPDSYISNVFVRPKKDNTHPMILNLKSLHKFVAYHHVKMDTFQTAVKLIRPGCFMASVDLRDTYYSISIASEDRKFLMFEWQGSYLQFTCLPNGLSCAPRIFTKILKRVYAHLRVLGHTCMGHIDDSLLIAQTHNDCVNNIHDTVHLFTKLGFIVHPEKSILKPTQEIEFLGFIIHSLTMTVRLPTSKYTKVQKACQDLLKSKHLTVQDVAHVIGLLVSSLPAEQFVTPYYRRLEINKITALRQNQGDYDAVMNPSEHSKAELLWWLNNITQSQRLLITSNPDLILTTDASLLGWGAVLNGMETGGHWRAEEQGCHINYLEMKAVLLGLKSLCPNAHDTHICVQSDNTIAVTYINAMGGVKSETCNDMVLQIWEWCIAQQIWLSAWHIPGSQNIQADTASRAFKDSVEWSLSNEVLQSLLSHWGPFHMDMFAPRLNYKVKDYVAWQPDPGAAFIDAFCVNWEPYFFYAFPPFSSIPRCLTKIGNGQATEVLIVPYWTTQSWFTPLLNLLVDNPLLLPQAAFKQTQFHL